MIRREVVRRVQTGMPINRSLPDPTVITPVTEHWLHDINHTVNQTVVDVPSSQKLVTTWIGIATVREMVERPMVMLYPREGSTAHTHPAALVQASWVTEEQAEAARRWISFLREDAQQSAFMDEGFRPATALALRCPICGQYGIDPKVPKAFDPSAIPPAVAQRIVRSWGDVKNPGVVVFVVDASPPMAGEKLNAAREGIIRAVDGMYHRNVVGLLTFAGSAGERVDPAPVVESRSRMWEALQAARIGGTSALYDAIGEAVQMADAAPAEASAIRGVVVLAGSRPNAGAALQDLVRLGSRAGKAIARCPALARDDSCFDEDGGPVSKGDVVGLRLAVETQHDVHVYFIGVGDGADLDVGRLMAEATGSNFLGTTVDDLAKVVQAFSEYF